MKKLYVSILLGIISGVWVYVYVQANDPKLQALMIIISIISAMRTNSTPDKPGLASFKGNVIIESDKEIKRSELHR